MSDGPPAAAFGQPRVLVTMSGPWPGTPDVLVPKQSGYLQFMARFVRESRKADAVILRGTSGLREGYAELVAGVLLKLLPGRRPRTLVGDATWDVTSRTLEQRVPVIAKALPWLARLVVRHAVDGPQVAYCVLSTQELRDFPQRWGVDPRRVHFVPFCATMSPRLRRDAKQGDYFFAGGDSYRDYDLLVEAASGLDAQVRVASSWYPRRSLPANVTVGWLPQDAYERALLGAKAVVVPLRAAARSAGQQTYLNAMMLGKLVIVTDSPGVRDYIEDGKTGLVVAPESGALRAALRWALDPANSSAINEIAERARKVVEEHFLMSHYFARLWELALHP